MMEDQSYPPEFLARLQAVTNLRPRRVIDHIMAHGMVTTEDLRDIYGYDHPPRAARDVRDEGIPLETFRVRNSQGRMIAAYRFGDPSLVRSGRSGGRRSFPASFKRDLLELYGNRCKVCNQELANRYLQIDHRVPYEVSGESDERRPEDYMLLCASCNRAKSWSCEHCVNWLEQRSAELCNSCYWGNPESYSHIATVDVRRLDILWSGEETAQYESLRDSARQFNQTVQDYVKAIISRYLDRADESRD